MALKIFSDGVATVALTFDEKFLYKSAVYLILQMVSICIYLMLVSLEFLYFTATCFSVAVLHTLHDSKIKWLSRTGEGLPGAVVSLHEWFEFRVINHTLLSPRNMFRLPEIY